MCDRVFFCFSDDPLMQNDLRTSGSQGYARLIANNSRFAVSMCDSAYYECPCCLVAANPFTCTCTQVYMRYAALDHVVPGSGWDNYICCAGYIPACCCFQPGQCYEKDLPRTCMCLEAWCCPGFAVSATRFLIMDHYALAPDPCDNRLVRANNCIQLLSFICHVAAEFDRNLRDLAHIVDCLADVVFLSTAGCMTAQVHHEMKYRTLPAAQASDAYAAVATTEAVAPLSVEVIKR